MSKLKKIILAGILVAVAVVFNRFVSINTPIATISLDFIPKIIIATLFGPWWSAFLFALVDLIGSLLFPFGAYFVGYTITAFIAGFIYGIFLHRKKSISNKKYLVRLIISTIIVSVVCNMTLNSIWIVITYKKAITAILPTRVIKELVLIPIRVIVMFAINAFFNKFSIYKMVLGEDQNEENNEETAEEYKPNVDDKTDEILLEKQEEKEVDDDTGTQKFDI